MLQKNIVIGKTLLFIGLTLVVNNSHAMDKPSTGEIARPGIKTVSNQTLQIQNCIEETNKMIRSPGFIAAAILCPSTIPLAKAVFARCFDVSSNISTESKK